MTPSLFQQYDFDFLSSQRSDIGDEGTKRRQDRLADITKLSLIRDKMVRDLEEKGVATKYLAEMKGLDIARMIDR